MNILQMLQLNAFTHYGLQEVHSSQQVLNLCDKEYAVQCGYSIDFKCICFVVLVMFHTVSVGPARSEEERSHCHPP